jgi:hypothetical protein
VAVWGPPKERLSRGLAGDAKCLGDRHPAGPVRDQLVDDVVDALVEDASPVSQPPQFPDSFATASTLEDSLRRHPPFIGGSL